MIDLQNPLNWKKSFKSILCLDGDLPSAEFLAQLALPIIAADGAANKLVAIDIIPHITIGDLDSIDPLLLNKLKTLHRPDQNSCDYQKAIEYMSVENLLPAIICGISGGAIDHILNNINLFMQSSNMLYTNEVIGHVLPADKKQIYHLPLGTKISCLGIPKALITSTGLEWELTQYFMEFPGANSCFNRTNSTEINLHVEEGKALILIYRDIA